MENRRVVVCCNLKPAKMRDIMSYGMVSIRVHGMSFVWGGGGELDCAVCWQRTGRLVSSMRASVGYLWWFVGE
jgi:hypothetical protein